MTVLFQQVIIIGFFILLIDSSSPFNYVFPAPIEGLGLNPILQDPALAIHPPILYLGYVGSSIIFSSVLAATSLNYISKTWAVHIKSWILLSWVFLTIGILLGIGFNLFKFEFSATTEELLKFGTSWIIPISLFTMGGVLYHYRVSKDYKIPATIISTSLLIQPSVVYLLGSQFSNIDINYLRNAVIMAAMAPGLNAYFFANMYGECRDVVATTILTSTVLTVFSSTLWIYFLY